MRVRELLEDLQGQKAKRLEFLLKTYAEKWKGEGEYPKGEEGLKKLIIHVGEKIDPSHNGMYMQWIISRVVRDPNENKIEDLDRLNGDLKAFEEHKAQIENKDINAYKTFYELFQVIDKFTKKPKSKAEVEAEKEEDKLAKAREGVTDIYKGPEGWIKTPTTQAAACFLGQNTRWCTASERSANMFSNYNKSDNLIVIYDKKTQSRHQLHIHSGQFADETDRTVSMNKIPEWARKPIIAWYKKHSKKLGLKHIFTFAGMGDTEAAKGTPHEEVVELMKKYGVV